MSELIILTIVIFIGFIGLAWYARQKSQQRSNLFAPDNMHNHDTDAVAEEFGAILQQEMAQQTNEDELEREPVVSLSGEYDLTQADPDEVSLTHTTQREAQTEQGMQSQRAFVDSDTKSGSEPAPIHADWELVLVLSVIAKQNQSFDGLDIKRVFDELALSYGAMKIYNKLIANHENQILFSVANMMSPGTLTPDQLATLKTKGLVFFATLPKPINGLTIFDEMLDTAIKTANKLNGELCDDKHQPITDNYLEHIRSKILHFNLTTQMEQSPS